MVRVSTTSTTSILKDTTVNSSVNLNPDPKIVDKDESVKIESEDVKDKKKEKKKKRTKVEDKKKDTVGNNINTSATSTSPSDMKSSDSTLSVPLNLSTEESGYESDLTRKTCSNKVIL